MKPIENWFEAFPIKDAEERLRKLMVQRVELDGEISDLRVWINRYRQRHPVESRQQPQPPLALRLSAVPANGDKPTFRSSILSTMAAGSVGKEWSLNELRHELASRGALTLDDNGNLKLLSMLSLMTKADQLERIKQGVYKLKVTAQEDRG
jgi:hypothetical protein